MEEELLARVTRQTRVLIGGARASESGFAGLSTRQWIICGVAALGFAFDLYEIVILPLVVRPVLIALGGLKPGSPEFNLWVGLHALCSIGLWRIVWRSLEAT